MNQYLEQVKVIGTGCAEGCDWACSQVGGGWVATSEKSIAAQIRDKAGKAKTYDWQDADERWLLIHAGGDPVQPATQAGPGTEYNVCKLQTDEVREAASCSDFDRVIFHDREWKWAKEVWRKVGLPELPNTGTDWEHDP